MLLQRLLAGFLSICAISAAHSADLLDTVKQKKELTVGLEAAYAPFEFIENGKIVGFDQDLFNWIMETTAPEVKIKLLDLPFQGILPGLAAKRFDVVITALTITKERAEKFDFTLPVADATTALVKRKGEKSVINAADIAGKSVGVQAGAAQLKVLQAFSDKLVAEGKPAVKIREYVAYDEAYADLAAGRTDAVAQSLPNLSSLIKSRPDIYEIINQPIGPKTYFAWAGRKDTDSASLVKFLSAGIAKAGATGKLKELQMKWFGFDMSVPSDAVPAPAM